MFHYKVNAGHAIKAVGTLKIQGQSIRFGDAESADSYGDFFDEFTETGMRNGDVRPYFIDHTFNSFFKANIVGYATMEKAQTGWEYEAVLKDNEFGHKAYEEIQGGCYASSSGAVYHTVRSQHVGDGKYKMLQWIVGEQSGTKTPADFL